MDMASLIPVAPGAYTVPVWNHHLWEMHILGTARYRRAPRLWLRLLHDICRPHRGDTSDCRPSLRRSRGSRHRPLFPHALYLAPIRAAAPRCPVRAMGPEVRADHA